MAVELVKSAAITNSDATPPVANALNNNGARVKEVVGMGELSATASIASIVRLVRVPSNARISRVLLSCDAITSAAADIGIYDVARRNSGAVVDVDFFASAQSLAAALVNTDVGHEADPADAGAGFGLADVEKMLWQALGLTVDPGIEYDIALTLTAAATAAGTVVLRTTYADGN
jgi:hypothetical protein